MSLISTPFPGSCTLAPAPARDLESILNRLNALGDPSLMKSDRGWFCYVKIRGTETGVRFDVDSAHDNPTPLAAALQCEERAAAALRKS